MASRKADLRPTQKTLPHVCTKPAASTSRAGVSTKSPGIVWHINSCRTLQSDSIRVEAVSHCCCCRAAAPSDRRQLGQESQPTHPKRQQWPTGREDHLPASRESPHPKSGIENVTNLNPHFSMIRSFFTIYLAASALCSSAQTPQVVVSPALCDVLYRGVPNPILIGSNGCPIDSMVLSTSHDHTLNCTNPGRCELTPSPDRNLQHAVMYGHRKTESGDLELVFEKAFRVRDIPDPAIFFAGRSYSSNTISRDQLLSHFKLEVRMPGLYWDIPLDVISFQLQVQYNNKIHHFSTEGNQLDANMMFALKYLQVGDRIRFESCSISLPDGTVRRLSALQLTVTN